jgi:hypothetical protein
MEYLKIEDKEDTDLLRKCVIDNWMEFKKKKKNGFRKFQKKFAMRLTNWVS